MRGRRASNPKDSPWRSPRQAQRRRKMVSLTLSDEARARLAVLAEERGTSRSQVVEALILGVSLAVNDRTRPLTR